MLNQILKTGGSQIISQLGKNFGMDATQSNQVLDVAGSTLKDGLLKEVTSGNLDGILSLVNGQSSSAASALSSQLTQSMVGGLMDKVGIKNDLAKKVASFVIPMIIQQFVNKKPSGGYQSDNLMDLIKGSAADTLKDKASDLLKGGLGKLFK